MANLPRNEYLLYRLAFVRYNTIHKILTINYTFYRGLDYAQLRSRNAFIKKRIS
jgi:hypothetical protein